jgi:hypothetical protein
LSVTPSGLVLNVLFGQLTKTDIELFLQASGQLGQSFAILREIATNGFVNFPTLAKAVAASPSTLRLRVSNLVAAGMLQQAVDGSFFRATRRARVLMRIVYLLLRERSLSRYPTTV